MHKKVDYIIVGLGISGSWLCHYLLQTNKTFVVIDNAKTNAASMVAGGVINPVTGRRVVTTWLIETIMPFAVEAYKNFDNQHNTPTIQQCNMLNFHASTQMQETYDNLANNNHTYINQHSNQTQWQQYFTYNYGVTETTPCWLVDMQEFVATTKNILIEKEILLHQNFSLSDCIFDDDNVSYNNIKANKIIFCDGINSVENSFFKNLPFAKNKGEALIVEIENLPRNYLYKSGLTIIPWKENLFWIGSSYQWNFEDDKPTNQFLENTKQQLNVWLKQPYKIVEHISSIRPATLERRPFVGIHPHYNCVGILNGMGTKGCSLAPYFANQLVQYLVNEKPILPEVDIKRFSNILKR